MDYAYKTTTHGLGVMAACMDLEKPLKITRIAFGDGKADEDTNLADVHELVSFVSDGAVTKRQHEANRLMLTIEYVNGRHPGVKTFLLSEFMIYVENPEAEDGSEIDFLYGSLGDYRQPVPAYNPAYPPSVFTFPLTVVISNDVEVSVSAPAGLVTYRELTELVDALGTKALAFTIPAEGWEADPSGGIYPYCVDIPAAGVTAKMIPAIYTLPEGTATAQDCGLCPSCQTLDGALRVWTKEIPAGPIPAGVTLHGDATGYLKVRDESAPYIPPATEDSDGGVKVGEGLSVTSDGTLSVDMASEAEVNKVLDEALAPNDNK